eukprot:10864270-Lingulodinium_polyedra.AAC.1
MSGAVEVDVPEDYNITQEWKVTRNWDEKATTLLDPLGISDKRICMIFKNFGFDNIPVQYDASRKDRIIEANGGEDMGEEHDPQEEVEPAGPSSTPMPILDGP